MADIDPSSFKFRKGGNIVSEYSHERMEAIRKASARNRPAPQGHVGINITQTNIGWTAKVSKELIRSAASSVPFPFQVVNQSTDEDAQVRIRFGTVSGIVPTIDEDPLTPDLEDSPLLEITGDGTRFIYIKLTLDDATFAIESVEIEEASSLPFDTNTEAHLTINTVEVDDGKIVSIGTPQVNRTLIYAFGGIVDTEADHIFF
jgi:hypothetical protein